MHFALNSVALIDPLLDSNDRKRTSWISWKAHVRLLSFCLRYEYAPSDGDVLVCLVNDFLTKFFASYPIQYHKPKHHMLKHLIKYFRYIHMYTYIHMHAASAHTHTHTHTPTPSPSPCSLQVVCYFTPDVVHAV